jgi:YD repeat-containing protein
MNNLLIILFSLSTLISYAQTFTYDNQNRLTAIDYADGKRIEYCYDKLGNRISEKTVTPYCYTQLSGFGTEGTTGINYQWQVNTGSGFNNINDGVYYFGTAQDSLIIINTPTNFAFNQYRCIITINSGTLFSNTYQLRIKATWKGSADTAWNNTANWECGLVPDQYVDVTIPSGRVNYPTINNQTNINSLKLEIGSSVIVRPGIILDIKSRQN